MLFNNISVVRYSADGTTSKEHFRVPLNYGPKEKFITRITQDPNLTKSVAVTVPRLSFEMTNLTYDSTRKQQSTLQNFARNGTINSVLSQYIPVPYNIEFSLSLYVRNHEDGTQIIEQILPYFTPDYNLTIDFIPEMGRTYDFPVILDSVNQSIEYEGDFSSTRLITWTLNFTAKTYMFASTSNPKIIKGIVSPTANSPNDANGASGGATINIYNDTNNQTIQKIYMANNSSNVANTNYAISEVVRVSANSLYGLVSDWDPSLMILYVSQTNGMFKPGMHVVGDYSNASYNISALSVSTGNTKMASITTIQKPLSANADSAYGFSDTITEYRR